MSGSEEILKELKETLALTPNPEAIVDFIEDLAQEENKLPLDVPENDWELLTRTVMAKVAKYHAVLQIAREIQDVIDSLTPKASDSSENPNEASGN